MSVLCCRVPDFLVHLALRGEAQRAGAPLALVGPDERLWAVSPGARAAGVRVEMSPRLARLRCPELALLPLDEPISRAAQTAFLAAAASWELPVEPLGWGAAYVDLRLVAQDAEAVQPLAADLGRRLRSELGEALQPALGWDSGKFTARAAAVRTAAGRMRLVGKAEEAAFLAPLPITLLPLPLPTLRRLHWLGIRTLAGFAALPAAAVRQQFGEAGRLAQRWAQGKDDRPVNSGIPAAPAALAVDFDPPAAQLAPVVESLLTLLRPSLDALAARLQGCRRLRLDLCFADGSERTLDWVWIEAVSDVERLRAALTSHLSALVWPAALASGRVLLAEVGEQPPQQLPLFPAGGAPSAVSFIERLCDRSGAIFLRGCVEDPGHPAAERRSAWRPWP